jgi:hypothetical protein
MLRRYFKNFFIFLESTELITGDDDLKIYLRDGYEYGILSLNNCISNGTVHVLYVDLYSGLMNKPLTEFNFDHNTSIDTRQGGYYAITNKDFLDSLYTDTCALPFTDTFMETCNNFEEFFYYRCLDILRGQNIENIPKPLNSRGFSTTQGNNYSKTDYTISQCLPYKSAHSVNYYRILGSDIINEYLNLTTYQGVTTTINTQLYSQLGLSKITSTNFFSTALDFTDIANHKTIISKTIQELEPYLDSINPHKKIPKNNTKFINKNNLPQGLLNLIDFTKIHINDFIFYDENNTVRNKGLQHPQQYIKATPTFGYLRSFHFSKTFQHRSQDKVIYNPLFKLFQTKIIQQNNIDLDYLSTFILNNSNDEYLSFSVLHAYFLRDMTEYLGYDYYLRDLDLDNPLGANMRDYKFDNVVLHNMELKLEAIYNPNKQNNPKFPINKSESLHGLNSTGARTEYTVTLVLRVTYYYDSAGIMTSSISNDFSYDGLVHLPDSYVNGMLMNPTMIYLDNISISQTFNIFEDYYILYAIHLGHLFELDLLSREDRQVASDIITQVYSLYYTFHHIHKANINTYFKDYQEELLTLDSSIKYQLVMLNPRDSYFRVSYHDQRYNIRLESLHLTRYLTLIYNTSIQNFISTQNYNLLLLREYITIKIIESHNYTHEHYLLGAISNTTNQLVFLNPYSHIQTINQLITLNVTPKVVQLVDNISFIDNTSYRAYDDTRKQPPNCKTLIDHISNILSSTHMDPTPVLPALKTYKNIIGDETDEILLQTRLITRSNLDPMIDKTTSKTTRVGSTGDFPYKIIRTLTDREEIIIRLGNHQILKLDYKKWDVFSNTEFYNRLEVARYNNLKINRTTYTFPLPDLLFLFGYLNNITTFFQNKTLYTRTQPMPPLGRTQPRRQREDDSDSKPKKTKSGPVLKTNNTKHKGNTSTETSRKDIKIPTSDSNEEEDNDGDKLNSSRIGQTIHNSDSHPRPTGGKGYSSMPYQSTKMQFSKKKPLNKHIPIRKEEEEEEEDIVEEDSNQDTFDPLNDLY